MSGPCSGRDRDCHNIGAGNFDSVTRRPSVSDDLDTVFALLSHPRRRYLLYYLFSMDGDVAELEAAANAVYEYEAAGTEADDVSREGVRQGLHHAHLPRLAEAGVVDYDRRQGTVRYVERPSLEEWAEHAHYKELDPVADD